MKIVKPQHTGPPLLDPPHQSPPLLPRAAAIYHFVRSNQIPFEQLAHTSCATILEREDAKQVVQLANNLAKSMPRLTLKQLEGLLETSMDKAKRRQLGVVYTPHHLIDHLIDHSLKLARPHQGRTPRFLDPACGSAGFLVEALEQFHRRFRLPRRQLLADHLAGIDRDAWAVQNAQAILELHLLLCGEKADNISFRLLKADPLLTPHETILKQCGWRDGADLVVTNPPYIKLQNLSMDYREALQDRFQDLANGSFSTSLLFLLAGQELLSPQGCFAMITQNNLFTSLAAKSVRQQLKDRQCLRRIVDFGSNHMFTNASAYTCLLFLGKQPSECFQHISLHGGQTPNDLGNLRYSTLRHSQLSEHKWRLAPPKHLHNVERIEGMGTGLGSIFAVRVGFATLKDKVYFAKQEGEQVWVAGMGPGEPPSEVEPAITRPAVKVASIGSQRELEHNRHRVIYPYKEDKGGKSQPLCEEELRDGYPMAYRHLSRNRAILQARDKGNRPYPAWYAWGRTQGLHAKGPKLLTKTFSRGPSFFLDPSDQLFCNGYGLFLRENHPRSGPILDAYLKILNSKLVYYYLKITSFQINGGYQCCQKNFIEHIGLPSPAQIELDKVLHWTGDELDTHLAQLYKLDQDAFFDYMYLEQNGQASRLP